MRSAVIFFIALEVDRVSDFSQVPVHVLQPPMQTWISMPDTADHQFEVFLVDCIEADGGGIKLDINFSGRSCRVHRYAIMVCKHGLKSV